MPTRVACPTCGAEAAWNRDNPWRPFCSERCKQIDLGAWATESYRVPVREEPDPGSESLGG
ncbi:MAG: DNA gyrase inhibitor YacG [Burkholderiales bacterium]|nr:DNA gyrase inhibitor YacG [Burkholderiales bacterium]